jgi:Zn-dependent M16 (insulinase) family peptidase
VIDQKCPKVSGYFAFATEIGDDSGAPHTLEHLVFMGSRSYKYKGVLDKLATRAYSFTNAWTGTDQTVYTLDTAGWEGFAQILPVYLEHCMLPTLTDEGCYTEVHHIDGTGNDAGVVYSEMQGVQNSSGELMDLEAKRLLYPEGNGYRYETGGMMEALRVLTPERIREFHKQMYQPKNLRVILIGEIDHTQLLEIMDEFEDGILDSMPPIDTPFTRPFVDSKKTPALEENIIKTVEFPEDDESSGEVLITFFGPDSNDMLQSRALNVLIIYLVGSSIGLLENTLVEKEELCSAVYGYLETRPDYLIRFSLTSVATEKLADVEKRFFEVVKEAAAKPFNMEYMHDCIKRFRRQLVYTTETQNTAFSDPMIEDHLFGRRSGEDLLEAVQSLKGFDVLETWTDKQWRDFFARHIADNKHVSILGVPSAKLSKTMKDKETARVKAQQEKYGEEGLKNLAKKLEEAKAVNDKPIPDGLLDSFKIPGTDSIHFIPSTTARSGLAQKMGRLDNDIQKIVDKDSSDDLPLFIHFEHVQTSFVHFTLILNTSVVPLDLKPLLSLYTMNFFDTPVERNGQRIDFEQIVMQLEKDTITYLIENGRSLGNSELIRIKFVVEPEKYEIAIKWLRDLLFQSIFDPARLKPTLTKMMADIPDEKRDGNDMAHSVDSMVHFAPASSSRAQNTLVKALYLKRIAKLLATSPETVVDMMEKLRESLLTFSNMRAFVVSDLTKLSNPVSTWKCLVQDLDTKQDLIPLDSRKAVLSQEAQEPGKLAYLVPMSTIDSSFASLTAKGPESYQHPKLPALMVALAYLDAVEGPFWVAVRGTGLAYGTNFARAVDTALLSFSIYRSPNAFQAYEAARNVIQEFVSGKRDFEKHSLEGAISSIVVGFVDEETTATRAAAVGFINQVIKGIPKDWGTKILRQVRAVTVDELMDVMKEFILPVFQPGSTDLVVTCATIMEEDLKQNFEKAGFKPEVRTLASFQDGYGLPAVEGEEDVEDGDDEEEDGEDDSEEEDDEEEDDEEEDDEEEDE